MLPPVRRIASRPAGPAVWCCSVVLAVAAGAAVAHWVKAPPYDDPFITFRYGANLRDGLGLVFNPGEQLLSTTTPLLALLLGALGAAFPTVDVAVLGYWLTLGALVLAGVLAGAVCWREGEPLPALLVPFAVVLTPSLVMSVGQEAGLLLALGLASFYLWRRRRLAWAGATLGLLTLTRPDGVLLAAILLAVELARRRRAPVVAAVAFALVVAPWYLYAWRAYGSPFPFSLAAKTAQAQTGWWPTIGSFLWAWLRNAVQQGPAYFALAAVGIAYAVKRARWVLLLLAWPVLQLVGYALLGVAAYPWYFAPLHGVVGLLAALGAGGLSRLGRRFAPGWLPAAATFAVVSLALVGPGAQYVRATGRNVPDPKARQYEAIGLWLREHTAPGSLVAALEMGRLGYFSQRPMFDFVGLVRASVVEHLRQKDLMWGIKSYQPDYVVAIPSDRWLVEDNWFQSAYVPLRRFVDPEVHGGQATVAFVRAVGDLPAQPPGRATSHRFGDRIELVGYSVERVASQGDDTISVILQWRVLRPVDEDYTVYVHALDRDGSIVAQADGPPLGGRRPTSRWRPGEVVPDPREVRVPRGADVVSLRVGWYLLRTMERLPGVDGAGQPAESALIALEMGR